MLLMIDNYDSFTYNLVQYFEQLGQEVFTYHHDAISISTIKSLNPQYIVISPGPNAPNQAGISLSVIAEFYQHIPILGVCLGHQCIGQFFGGKIISAPQVMHGKTSNITHHQRNLFLNLPQAFKATRYHSLCIDPESLPSCLEIDAWTDDTIMAITHRHHPVFGVQFHPEAILSEYGMQLLENFLHAPKRII